MKKKTIIIVLIVSVILAVTGGMIMRFRNRHIFDPMDGPGMIHEDTFDFNRTHLKRVAYRKFNGESGERLDLEVSISQLEDGSPETIATFYYVPYLDQKETDKEVRSGSYLISNIEEIIENNHMREWTDLPEAEFFALDGPNIWFEYEYSDGSCYSFSNTDEVPDWGAVNQIVDYIMQNCSFEG